ncbi:MAG: RNA polymerase sigma factor, partial [Muribaculaceae bacterium]|nr:RNA polymerase sigma factor [Muribaculaceae bacterium]
MIERICFGYSSSVSEMEDLRQDALLNLWESMPSFKKQCSMKTWIYRITLNTCVSAMRKSYRKASTVELSELYDKAETDTGNEVLIAELHEAIGKLSPIDKAIMLLWL